MCTHNPLYPAVKRCFPRWGSSYRLLSMDSCCKFVLVQKTTVFLSTLILYHDSEKKSRVKCRISWKILCFVNFHKGNSIHRTNYTVNYKSSTPNNSDNWSQKRGYKYAASVDKRCYVLAAVLRIADIPHGLALILQPSLRVPRQSHSYVHHCLQWH